MGVEKGSDVAETSGAAPSAPPLDYTRVNGVGKTGTQALTEETLREELLMYIGERCCWATRPARTWNFSSVRESKALTGRLETFVEIRKTVRLVEAYSGGPIDGAEEGAVPELWEVPVKGYAPPPFQNREVTLKVPHTEDLEGCKDCDGNGGVPCPSCNGGLKSGTCSACQGLGQTLSNGETKSCARCWGSGRRQCSMCSSVGLRPCAACGGQGRLLARDYVVISWITITTQKVSHENHTLDIPEDKMFRVKGVDLIHVEDNHLNPLVDPDHPQAQTLSMELFERRNKLIPNGARVIRERHFLAEVPITTCILSHGEASFSFSLVGTRRSVYLKNYPTLCSPGARDCLGCFSCCLGYGVV